MIPPFAYPQLLRIPELAIIVVTTAAHAVAGREVGVVEVHALGCCNIRLDERSLIGELHIVSVRIIHKYLKSISGVRNVLQAGTHLA